MKLILSTLLLLILISCLPAITYSTDECIDLVLMFGHVQDIQGVPCFVSKYYDDWELPTRSTAITYLADTGSVFAIVQKNLDTYKSTPETDENERDYLAAMDLTYIKEEFGRNELNTLTQDQQIEFCERIVKAHCVIEDITVDLDE
jgi:hypothetical protein